MITISYQQDKAFGLLCIANKAGKLAVGELQALNAVKALKAHLVILAADTGAATRKRLSDKCAYRNVKTIVYGTKQILAKVCGKEQISVIAVVDKSFADAIAEKIVNTNPK